MLQTLLTNSLQVSFHFIMLFRRVEQFEFVSISIHFIHSYLYSLIFIHSFIRSRVRERESAELVNCISMLGMAAGGQARPLKTHRIYYCMQLMNTTVIIFFHSFFQSFLMYSSSLLLYCCCCFISIILFIQFFFFLKF